MKTTDIRQRFLDYFAARGHEVVPSSSLVPGDDPTLLFTNAGMVQFKDVFLGNQTREIVRATTAQRCVRAGGKHNDLDNVGYTARHHTFFEMLGNFSFGDYFKAEAIAYAWDLLTVEFGLPAERLWVTVYEEDDEAARIWLDDIGVSKTRFSRIGAQDNFWSMGDVGPCGPCSEVFYDHGPEVAGGPPGSPQQDGDRYVEVWNLVFMQFNREADGKLTPLPNPAVDTGLGLERMAAILQGVRNNYDIDLFRSLIAAAAAALGVAADDHKSLRVIADHIRSTAFLLVDGVLPANDGRGYVLRRIIRRAVRHGHQLGCRTPFLHRLVAPLVAEMGDAYPQLAAREAQVTQALLRENEKFNETLEQGLKILDREIAALSGQVIPGEVAFKLYDTFGFPVDLTADVAREHGLTVDLEGFDREMAAQRARARAASQFAPGQADAAGLAGLSAGLSALGETRFIGHSTQRDETDAVLLLCDEHAVEELTAGQRGAVALARTPFYAESGGQVGDRGEIHFADGVFTVENTQYAARRAIAHIGAVRRGRIRVGQRATAVVDADFRRQCANNHSATHLLHAALKHTLGAHVQQKGSLVEAARLRFDFAHPEAMDDSQISAVEGLVNHHIRANLPAAVEEMALEAAKARGAEALFGEKYEARVRVVRMGDFSLELCGGTHVARSGDIGMFKIISQSGIAAGVRRIEALTGAAAEKWLAQRLAQLAAAAAAVHAKPQDLAGRVRAVLDHQREQVRQIQALQAKLLGGATESVAVEEINGVKMIAIKHDDADAKAMRRVVDHWKQKLGSGIVLVAGTTAERVILIAGVTADLAERYPAGRLIKSVSPLLGGHGGGKAELAQGGGTKVDALDDAWAAARRWVAAA